MVRVKSEALQPGMIVARDIKNIDGMRCWRRPGCELSERQINIRLQAWGVTDVEIEAGQEMAAALDPAGPIAAGDPGANHRRHACALLEAG